MNMEVETGVVFANTGFSSSNVDYAPDNAGLSYQELAGMANKEAVNNIVADRLTPIGIHYKRLIGGYS